MIDNYYYVLDKDGNAVPCSDCLKWAEWFGKASRDGERIVRQDHFDWGMVSTVFLGIDHSFSFGTQKPILWETMVFGKEDCEVQRRYSSKEEALKGHMEVLEWVQRTRKFKFGEKSDE